MIICSKKKSLANEWRSFVFVNLLATLTRHRACRGQLRAQMRSITTDLFAWSPLSKSALLALNKFEISFDFKKTSNLNYLFVFFCRDLPGSIVDDIVAHYSLFAGKYQQSVWTIYHFVLDTSGDLADSEAESQQRCHIDDQATLDKLFAAYTCVIEMTTPQSMAAIVQCAASLARTRLLQSSDDDSRDQLVQMYDRLSKLVWEIAQDVRHFSVAFETFLDVVLCTDIFATSDTNARVQQSVLKICEEILRRGEQKPNVIRPLLTRLLRLASKLDERANESFIPLLVRFLTYGDVYKKEKK